MIDHLRKSGPVGYAPGCAEASFLLDCVRKFFRPEHSAPIPSNLSWDRVLPLAQEHSVESLLCLAVQNAAPDEVPGEVHSSLMENFREMARFNLMLSAELARILALLEDSDIDVRALKGPVLAETLYGNVAMRSFSDLDLFLRPEDLLRTRKALETIGYSLTSTLHWPCDSACFRGRGFQLSFANPIGVSVDVHWRLLPACLPEPLYENHVWPGRSEVPVGGGSAWTLSREHTLLFLCAHGAQHLWTRLGWICDVARMIQVETEMDWDYLFAQAAQTRTKRMLALGLTIAADLLDGDIPAPALDWIAAERSTKQLAAIIWKRFLDRAPIPVPPLQMPGLSARTFDRASDSILSMLGVYFSPSEAEFQIVSLPPALFVLYYLFRPLRIPAKYLAGLVGLSHWTALGRATAERGH